MTEATPEAPDAQPEAAPVDRTLTWWPLIGAAVIAALVAVVIFVAGAGDDNRSGSRVDEDGALACPGTYPASVSNARNRVPAIPSGVDGKADLVPDVSPRYVAICRYLPAPKTVKQDTDLVLDGRIVLDKGQRAATRELNKATKASGPRSCTAQVATAKSSYLVGFTFDTGIVWVSVPGDRCVPASNGQFVTDTDLQPGTANAYRARLVNS